MPLAWFAFAACGLAAPAWAASAGAVPAREAQFAQVIKPFVSKHCVECHDDDIQKADLNLAALTDGQSLEKHRETWEKVFGKLRHGEMPPKDEPRPDAGQAKVVTQWLMAEFKRQDAAAPV
ncbi:MAG: c-type cytochrome domain-containing protein [Opitutaceae bacterium]